MNQFVLKIDDTIVATSKSGWSYLPELKLWESEGNCFPDTEKLAAQFQQIMLVSPPQFKMMFTPQERVALRMARTYTGTDNTMMSIRYMLEDWFDIIDDPRLTVVDLSLPQTVQGLEFLVPTTILTEERVAEILKGVLVPVA